MRELAIYRAVQAAREDIAEGIRLSEAAAHAARRFNVSTQAVVAYTQCADAGCRKAAADLADDR